MPCRPDFADVALAAEDRAAVMEAAQVLSDHLPVERVVLYGSKARGEKKDSPVNGTSAPVFRLMSDS
jgi:hypothetical protein